MNFQEIINEQLFTESTYILEEGLFKVSPAIAFFAFKDDVIGKIDKTKQDIKGKELEAKQKIEKVKAKVLGKSGNKDTDTVYAYTKEQKKVLSQIYKKYGPQIVKQINDFRNNIATPYQVIKREVAKNYMETDKTRFGMTKEEYYRYRESGRRKIEKKGTFFKDHDSLNKEQDKAREALKKAREDLQSFKTNGNFDLSASNLEKVFDEAGLGIKELKGWTQNELSMTLNEIERLQNILKNQPEANGKYKISGSTRTGSANLLTREEINYRISALREKGITNVNNAPNKNNNKPYGSFKDAMAIYLLRRERIAEIKKVSLNSEYRKFYEKVLKDGIEAANKIYENKFNNFMNLKNTITFNQYEAKIWKKKILGNEFSGDINDWELKIKPEDFKGVSYKEKSPKIIQAEKDFDRELKRFERNLLKIMSEEDVAICKKYKLFNNFLTIKQLKDPSSMFKKENIKLSDEGGDVKEKIDSIIEKDYNSIRELEAAQSEIKHLMNNDLSSEDKKRCEEFLKKINPKNTSGKKNLKKDLEELLDKIINTDYSKTSASEALKELEDKLEDFKKLNDESELKSLNYNINKAKDKLNIIVQGAD